MEAQLGMDRITEDPSFVRRLIEGIDVEPAPRPTWLFEKGQLVTVTGRAGKPLGRIVERVASKSKLQRRERYLVELAGADIGKQVWFLGKELEPVAATGATPGGVDESWRGHAPRDRLSPAPPGAGRESLWQGAVSSRGVEAGLAEKDALSLPVGPRQRPASDTFTNVLPMRLPMPASKPPTTRVRHDPRKWILKALESGKPDGMLTSEIMASAASLSGSKIPAFSIYSALRTLKKRKEVSVTRRGRELVFTLMTTAKPEPMAAAVQPSAQTPAADSAAQSPTVVTPVPQSPSAAAPVLPTPGASTPAPIASVAQPPLHKLVPGEALILHIGEEHVDTATNVHGKIVLERHKRP
jgi:hypothetical protein